MLRCWAQLFANPGLKNNQGSSFHNPNHIHSHNLSINKKESSIYNLCKKSFFKR